MTGAEWLQERERGNAWVLNLTLGLARALNRTALKPLVAVVALWYRAFDRGAVRASKDWLQRVHGRPPGYWEVYRHLRTFAQVTCDRLFLVMGRMDAFEFTRTGREHLHSQLATGRGAVLLGAHLGSYEAMRACGIADDVAIKVVGYFKNSAQINATLARLDPDHNTQFIHLGEDAVGAMLSARAAIERGELVALLGDRVGLGRGVVRAEFMGQDACFPAGPFLLAAALKCPIYTVFGEYREPNTYDLYCEPFAPSLTIARGRRQADLEAVVQRYAIRLEEHARRSPYNWFNFFDFWTNHDAPETP